MEIAIDLDDETPPFSQLVSQVKGAVLAGELKPGDALPSIRQLAGDLGLNNKTVAKAYRFLERDSVIQTKGYRGTFVHPDAKANSKVDLKPWVERKILGAIQEIRAAGVTQSEIRNQFGNVMNTINGRGEE